MKGECLCGAVKFEIREPVPNIYQCHCSECRKATGSSANAATLVYMENFRWLDGEDKISSYRKQSGYRNDFCSVCGSSVPNTLWDTNLVWIPAGLLEESNELKIAVHIFMNSQAAWEKASNAAKKYAETPGIDAVNIILQRSSS